MRIAFLNRGRVHPGGDLIALDATMEALRKRGHTCVETGWDRTAMATGNFDLAHIYHCDFDWSNGNYEAVLAVGLPYVVTPIYYGFSGSYARAVLSNARFILPFSHTESGLLPILHGRNVRVIPNGTDEMFHAAPLSYVRNAVYGVLCVSARGDTDKGVPTVSAICQRLGVPFELATGLTREQLAQKYFDHKVFVNASTSERMSLTTGEALCAGCRVLDTSANWGGEHYPGLVRFDPTDEGLLERLIRWALTAQSWDWRPNEFARTLTWQYHAECLERVYKEVIGG